MTRTPLVLVYKHPLDLKFVSTHKPPLELPDAFINFLLNLPLINTTIFS